MGEAQKDVQSPHGCLHLQEILKDQFPLLEKEIERHTYFLGLKLQREVTKHEAEIDYMQHNITSVAIGFKYCYCNYVCQDREECTCACTGESLFN